MTSDLETRCEGTDELLAAWLRENDVERMSVEECRRRLVAMARALIDFRQNDWPIDDADKLPCWCAEFDHETDCKLARWALYGWREKR